MILWGEFLREANFYPVSLIFLSNEEYVVIKFSNDEKKKRIFNLLCFNFAVFLDGL